MQYTVPIVHLVAGLLRPSEHFDFPMTDALRVALTRLRSADSSEDAEKRMGCLHHVLLALWTTRWEASAEAAFPDPTMSFLMLFSLKESGEFSEPKETTGPIARLCRAIQLAMVTQIHLLVKKGRCANQMEALKEVRGFVVEKQQTTFSSLMSLQHYASALVYQSMSMPNIWWTDREKWQSMMFKGQRISMAQLNEIFDNLEARIIELWEKKVLLGLDLHVEYGDLADNLLETRAGYSFLDDPGNPFHKLGDALATAIFNDPTLLNQFTRLKTDGSGERELNMIFCRQWMKDLAELEGLCMLAVEMLSGAAPRGTELAAMLIRNTFTRLRNLRGLGRYVAIVRQYDKTTNNMQADRLIPHALSAVNADMIVQIHALARPFARVSVYSSAGRAYIKILVSSWPSACFRRRGTP